MTTTYTDKDLSKYGAEEALPKPGWETSMANLRANSPDWIGGAKRAWNAVSSAFPLEQYGRPAAAAPPAAQPPATAPPGVLPGPAPAPAFDRDAMVQQLRAAAQGGQAYSWLGPVLSRGLNALAQAGMGGNWMQPGAEPQTATPKPAATGPVDFPAKPAGTIQGGGPVLPVPRSGLTDEENSAIIARNRADADKAFKDIELENRTQGLADEHKKAVSTLEGQISLLSQDYDRMVKRPEMYGTELAMLRPQLAALQKQHADLTQQALPAMDKTMEAGIKQQEADQKGQALPSAIAVNEANAAKSAAETGLIQKNTAASPSTWQESVTGKAAIAGKMGTDRAKNDRILFTTLSKITNSPELSDDEKRKAIAAAGRSFYQTFGYLPEH